MITEGTEKGHHFHNPNPGPKPPAPGGIRRRITNPNLAIQLDSDCGIRHERILISCKELDSARVGVRVVIEHYKEILRKRIILAGFTPGKEYRTWMESRIEGGLPDYEQFSTVELLILRGEMRKVPEDKKHLEKVIEILLKRGIGSIPA